MMKKILLCSLLLAAAINTYSQDNDYFSFEVRGNYNYYIGDQPDGFNYGFSGFVSKYLDRIKVSVGINYSKRYYQTGEESYSTVVIDKHEYNLAYINVPLLARIDIYKGKYFTTSAMAGCIFYNLNKYEDKRYYSNGEIYIDKDPEKSEKNGFQLTTGVSLSRPVGDSFALNLGLSFSYSIITGGLLSFPDSKNSSHGLYTPGISLGIEYFLKKADRKY